MFKVGDKVRIIHNNWGKSMGHDPDMDQYVNTEDCIKSVHSTWVKLEGNTWSWDFESLELVKADPAVKTLAKEKKPSFRQELTKKCNASGSGVSFWGYISSRGKREFKVCKICHADFRYEGVHKKYYENISNHVKKKVGDKKAYREYVNYILNDSPWAFCFVTKKYGVGVVHNIEMNVNVPPSEFMGAITALRMGSEFPNHLRVWKDLVRKHGCTPNEAMLIAALFKGDTNMHTYNGGHWIIGDFPDIKLVIDFFKNGYKPSEEKTVAQGNTYFKIWKNIYTHRKQTMDKLQELYPEAKVTRAINHWDVDKVHYPSYEGLVQRTKELYAQA